MPSKTFSTSGIVLKRSNVGEADRIVHLLTKEYGKLTCVAKGVRKISSSKRALLEPGNYVKGFFVETKTLPLLTQATILEDCSQMDHTLPRIRQLSQVLEIFEKLFVEQELDGDTFETALMLRDQVVRNRASGGVIRQELRKLITSLGYQDPEESKYENITEYVSALADRPLRSYEFLRVQNSREL